LSDLRWHSNYNGIEEIPGLLGHHEEAEMPDIATLRQRAAQARRLAWATTDDRVQAALEQLVDDLEKAADSAELAEMASGQSSHPGPRLQSWDDCL
jgi:hypothetical protein